MKKQLLLYLALLIVFSCGDKKQKEDVVPAVDVSMQVPDRYVIDNRLISTKLPEISIQVAEEFEYIGSFDFKLKANPEEAPPELKGKPVAGGQRYVFVKTAANKKIEKLFIVQLEGFLPGIDFRYNYNFNTADSIGNNKYRHNTWFYDSVKLAEENPEKEGALTRAFLEDKGYSLEDQIMMSRWVGLASADRKNEIIIYYEEMLKNSSGYTLEAYKQLPTKQANAIRNALIERSWKSFKIVKG